jgi:hypothetical protein
MESVASKNGWRLKPVTYVPNREAVIFTKFGTLWLPESKFRQALTARDQCWTIHYASLIVRFLHDQEAHLASIEAYLNRYCCTWYLCWRGRQSMVVDKLSVTILSTRTSCHWRQVTDPGQRQDKEHNGMWKRWECRTSTICHDYGTERSYICRECMYFALEQVAEPRKLPGRWITTCSYLQEYGWLRN